MAIYRALTVSRRTAVALHRTSITGRQPRERAVKNVRSSRLVCLAIRFTNWMLGRRHRQFGQATVDRGVIALAIAAIGGTGPRDDGRTPAHPVGNFASRTARRTVTLTPGDRFIIDASVAVKWSSPRRAASSPNLCSIVISSHRTLATAAPAPRSRVPPVLSGRDQASPIPSIISHPLRSARYRESTMRLWRLRGCRCGHCDRRCIPR